MTHQETNLLPGTMLAWPLYGAGIENLGQDGKAVRWPVPRPGPDDVLVRSDAVGLCFSDVKIIRLGGDHPRLYNRDLAVDPIVQGHEVSLTIIEVGERWQDRFRPGDRIALQADVYYGGRNLAYGYVFHGGLAQYGLLGPQILAGDEGCYAIPVPDGLGYAEVALTEPWACVVAAYVPRRRVQILDGGVLWVVGRPGLKTGYRLGTTLAGGKPRKIVFTDVPASLVEQFEGIASVVRDGIAPAEYAALAQAEASGGFDDIIVLDPSADLVEAISPAAAYGGTINIIGDRPLGRRIKVDVGRVHYDYLVFMGARGPDIGAAYGHGRNRAEVKKGGVAWIVGAGGPMGRMHLQRMLQMPDHPSRIVVSESNPMRQSELTKSFGALARENGIDMKVVNPNQFTPKEYDTLLREAHGGRGFDDIVVIVASAPAVEAAMPQLAPDGLLVVFGGLARGTMAALDLSPIYLGGAQITGSAGSTIQDQAAVLDKVWLGHLSTAGAVAAIGGMDAAKDGIQGLMDRRFPGKMVIYPQVESFPLTSLVELREVAPTVYALLSPSGEWTREAEQEFLRRYAPGVYE